MTILYTAKKKALSAFTSAFLLHTLNNPNAYGTSANDNFGSSVSISGNYAIVGARREDDAGGTDSGKAYIFDVTTGSLLRTINNPNAYSTSAGDGFGSSVSISGNYAVVGAPDEDANSKPGSGKVYIFDVTTGALLRTISPGSPIVGGRFGYVLAVSENYTAISTWTTNNVGSISVHETQTGNVVSRIVHPAGEISNVYFGQAVAISGNLVLAGAYGSTSSSGKVYIFNATTGSLLHTLDNPNAYGTSASDQFGWSVAISGNYAIVGARGEGEIGNNSSGKAYIFDVTTGSLLRTINNPNAYGTSATDNFGSSVSISGNYAVVGAPQEDDASGLQSGKVYIFDVATGNLIQTLDNPNPVGTSENDNFGSAVSIYADKIVISTVYEDDVGGTDSGKAYIYTLS